jgi:hypothetical protein
MEEQLICSRCGTFIPDRHHLTWADDGKHLCYPCRERIDEANKKRRKIFTGREEIYVTLLFATAGLVGALFIGWALVFAVPTWNRARRRLARSVADDEVRAALGMHRVVITIWLWGTGIVGAALSVLYVVNVLSALAAMR